MNFRGWIMDSWIHQAQIIMRMPLKTAVINFKQLSIIWIKNSRKKWSRNHKKIVEVNKVAYQSKVIEMNKVNNKVNVS